MSLGQRFYVKFCQTLYIGDSAKKTLVAWNVASIVLEPSDYIRSM